MCPPPVPSWIASSTTPKPLPSPAAATASKIRPRPKTKKHPTKLRENPHLTEPFPSPVDTLINSDFVERRTMSFSLWTVVAEHSKKQNSQPQNWLRLGADASAIHGRLGCSGCT